MEMEHREGWEQAWLGCQTGLIEASRVHVLYNVSLRFLENVFPTVMQSTNIHSADQSQPMSATVSDIPPSLQPVLQQLCILHILYLLSKEVPDGFVHTRFIRRDRKYKKQLDSKC